MKYQDRILYGTDLAFFVGQDAAAAEKKRAEQYATDWTFFSSDKTVAYRGKEVQGLGLPPEVLRKLYHDNALHWIRGVVPSGNATSTRGGRP